MKTLRTTLKNSRNRSVALVTGASRGIGRAIAHELARVGYDLVINYHVNNLAAKEVARECKKLGAKAWVCKADLTKEVEVKRLFKTITTEVGRLDLLVNNAGYDYAKMIEDYNIREMRYLVDLLLISRFLTTKLALPLLKKSQNPNIVNIASRMGLNTTIATIGPYGAAEAGVIKFTQCCAIEFAPYSIRVNCVAPGLTKTDLTKAILTQSEFADAAQTNPSHRVGLPEDVAKVVKFVASKDASYINGATIPVTGGGS